MDSSEGASEAASYQSFGPPYDTCGRCDRSNTTWEDGIKDFFSTFFASPRMWPLGYIFGSPYSPLRVEREISTQINWRDAFEDLLALEAGRSMIPSEHRKAEDAWAVKDRYRYATEAINSLNTSINNNMSFDRKIQQKCARMGEAVNPDVRSIIEVKLLPLLEVQREHATARAQKIKSDFENSQNRSASALKPRGSWITSLITSGAVPGWRSRTTNSIEGPVVGFSRINAPPDLDGGVRCSETELVQWFENGASHGFGEPEALPVEVVDAMLGDKNKESKPYRGLEMLRAFRPSLKSVWDFGVGAEATTMGDGSIGTKVKVWKRLCDGKDAEASEFVDEPVKVLEEVENARRSMASLRETVVFPPQPDYGDEELKTVMESMGDDDSTENRLENA